VRYSAWCLAASLLVCVFTRSGPKVGGTEAQEAVSSIGACRCRLEEESDDRPQCSNSAIVIDQSDTRQNQRRLPSYALLRSAMTVPSNLRPADRMR
jgi:hypothetical protein